MTKEIKISYDKSRITIDLDIDDFGTIKYLLNEASEKCRESARFMRFRGSLEKDKKAWIREAKNQEELYKDSQRILKDFQEKSLEAIK